VSEDAPITILFTDVEGSTDLRSRRGDKVAHEILRAHEEVVRGCITRSGGREVKALGDGFMIAFTSARKALACAIAIQQAVDTQRWSEPDRAVRVRIGVNTGEVVEERDDLYGQAVNAAARVAGRAKAGQILVAEVTRHLVGPSPEFVFVDRGRLRLKGIPERRHVFELTWALPDEARPDMAGGDDRTPYVGRAAERAELRRLLDGAVAGKGAVVMVGGQPGVGKTRLAEELMAEASRRDLEVFVGHSYEMEGAAPYVAVVEILEAALARAPTPQAWREFLADDAAEVARLLPKLRQLCPDIPAPLEVPPEQERRLLFNSVRDVVERSARHRPLVLVFDDLHWADDPTLLCIEHLAERVSEMPVLLVATYRDTEVDVGRPLAKTFEDLRRRHLAGWVTLSPLPEGEVAEMLGLLSGQDAPSELIGAVYFETEGNPFFVEEVYRYLAEEGRLFDPEGRFRPDLSIGELDVPAGVRLVVGRRLDRLQAGTKPVLTAAAVVGRAFSVELLEAIVDAAPDSVLDAVEDAERGRLITPSPDASGEDRFVFAHELIRQTLLVDLSLTRRRRLHARVADALERHHAADLGPHSATIAHHLLEAGSAGDPERAYGNLVQAARFAMDSAAFEEALRHYERASALEAACSPAERAGLLFELATARRSAGKWDAAIDAWRGSIAAYTQLDDVEAVGRVCLAASYTLTWTSRFAEGVEMAQRGLAALGERVTADRVRLLGMAGVPAAYGGLYDTSCDLIGQALSHADQLPDQAVLGEVLMFKAMAHVAFLELKEAADAGLRAATLLRAVGDLWSVSSVLGFILDALRYLGRLDEAAEVSRELGPLAERLGNYGAILMNERTKGIVDLMVNADLDQLEAFARRDLGLGERTEMPWLTSCSWSWLGLAQFLRGDWEEARSLLAEGVRLEPPGAVDGWCAAILFECLAYLGERSEALALLDTRRLPKPGEAKLSGAAAVLVSAVDGLTMLGERERAAALYPALIDCFDRTGVPCPSFIDGRLYERSAGIAALAGRDWDTAEAHFRAALRQAAELPHRIEEAHTRRWYGQMLLERAEPGDRGQAETLLTRAVEDYDRLGMPRHRNLTAGLFRDS